MVERFLFIIGERNAGKSTQLRSLFVDPRLGTNGQIPTRRKLVARHRLSIDRSLYFRLTSPHESGESLDVFMGKISKSTNRGRWCVVAPLQPDAFGRMPDLVKTVRAVIRKFGPERIRV